jgi:hypothetical protein
VEAVKPVPVVGQRPPVHLQPWLWAGLGVAVVAATGFTAWHARAKPPEAPYVRAYPADHLSG